MNKTNSPLQVKHVVALSILISLCYFNSASGQTTNIVSYENLNDPDFVSSFKTNFDINAGYQTKDGSVLNVGSKLIIGTPYLNESKKDNNPFNHWQDVSMLGKIKAYSELFGSSTGEEVTILEIKATTDNISKKAPRTVTIFVENTKGKKRNLNDYETALRVGEVRNPNAALTRDQAIKKLKESKDLLDLGMMTQHQYDSVRDVLSPIIMKN